MAPYTENDVQNILINFQNRVILTTAVTQNEVLYSTLCNYGNGT